MNSLTIETKGFAELHKVLSTLSPKMHDECLEKALKAGGKEIIPAIQRNIRSSDFGGSGLIRSISIRVNKKLRTSIEVQLGPWLKTARYYTKQGGWRMVTPWYAHMVEWGTSSHNAKPSIYRRMQAGNEGKKWMMKFRTRHGWVTKESIRGFTGQRPFTKGFDEKKMAFLDEFGKYVSQYIAKHFKKTAPNITRVAA